MTKKETTVVSISKPDIRTVIFQLEGMSPLVIHKFSKKAFDKMKAAQEAGSKNKSKNAKAPKDFEEEYEGAKRISTDGWCGINAACFRNAMISACRAAGFVMTRAKLGVFIEPDGFDASDGAPLVKITGGDPEMWVASVRLNGTTTDLRARPMWRNWGCNLRVKFDAGMFSETDVANLLTRAGIQVGIGEGRPDSKSSNGLGYGLFQIKN